MLTTLTVHYLRTVNNRLPSHFFLPSISSAMAAFGRKQPLRFRFYSLFEWLLLVKADTQEHPLD
jgi:hypothetical protein